MKNLFLALTLLASVTLWSCNKPAETTSTTVTPDSLAKTAAPAPKNAAQFVCTEIRSLDDEAPLSELAIQVGDQKIPVDSISHCEIITPDAYDNFEIPKTALQAAGGWWAGAGDYFYLAEEGNDYVVYYGWAEEEADEKDMYQYKEVKRVKAN
jgi:hypothetical protein